MDEEIEAFIDSALKAAAIVAVPASRPKRARRRRSIANRDVLVGLHSQHTQHANGHTKHKTFTPRTHHTRFIQMLADM